MNYTVAFVGNPNVGKSAWINALSNADFKVGNWPGVTVEKKEAFVHWGNDDFHIIDLPGTHSLEDSDNEESITARYLRNEHIDLIVNVVDATNLSSNLMLTLCLREMQLPMLIILNFMDEARKLHIQIDDKKLTRRLQIDILPYSALDRTHYATVRQSIQQHVGRKVFYYPLLSGEDEKRYVAIYNYIDAHSSVPLEEDVLHTMVIGYLRHDALCEKQLQSWLLDMPLLHSMRGDIDQDSLRLHYYQCITSLMKYVKENDELRFQNSRKIDALLLHRYFGLPIFFVIFSFVLLFVFQMSAPFNDFIAYMMNDVIRRYVGVALTWAPEILRRMVLDGIVAGVGGVLVFVPVMAFLYFMMSLLEESGYMSRISFLLDRAMKTFHLSGKSFVALLLGFGCNVPAIYATRTLNNEKQRRLSAVLIPFMSCGARLPVYVLFASAFFPHHSAYMILCVYGMGILLALILAVLFSRFSFMKDDALYIEELPPYRKPSIRVVLHKVQEEIKSYIHKAMGIVLWAMIILWGLSYFPYGSMDTSYIAQASRYVQPIFEPLGFGDRWECIAALPGGILAKETIVGYFEQVLGREEKEENDTIDVVQDAREIGTHAFMAIQESVVSLFHPSLMTQETSKQQVLHIKGLWDGPYAKLKAFSFMIYVLLSVPCIMTLQALYHEYGFKLMLLSICTMIIVPYATSFLIFQLFSHIG